MPRSRISRFKPLIYTLALLCVWWATPVAIKALTRNVFYEFQAPAWAALSHLGDLQSYWGLRAKPKDELIEAGRDMARLNAAYMLRLQEAEADQAELRRLETLLDLPPNPEYQYVVARVVRRDLDTWWHHVVIRKGSTSGIREGDAVVYREGVLGRVTEVHAYTSVVELISSASFRVAAHIEDDLRPVTFVGQPAPAFNEPSGRLTNVPSDIAVGETGTLSVVTSRLGGVFPDGLMLGTISEFEPAPDGIFQSAKVRLNPSLLSVQEVAVLVPVSRDMQEIRLN